MKKVLLFVAVSLTGLIVKGQQLPRFTFDYMNPYRLHAAAAGYENGHDIVLNYREQWVGMTGVQGRNPQTFGLSYSGRIKPARLGIGVNLMTDRTGGFRYTGGQLSLAYHLKLSSDDKFQLGFGLAGRFYMVNYDPTLAVTNQGADPTLLTSENSFLADASAGLFVHGHGLKAGFTVNNLFNVDMNFTDVGTGVVSKQARHYDFTASYEHHFSDKFGIEPMFGMRTLFSEKIQFDLGGRMMFAKDAFFVGTLFRFGGQSEGISAMGGFNIKKKFSVGYSYDYALTKLQSASNGSHEAFIKLAFGKDGMEKKEKEAKEGKEKADKPAKEAKVKTEKVATEKAAAPVKEEKVKAEKVATEKAAPVKEEKVKAEKVAKEKPVKVTEPK